MSYVIVSPEIATERSITKIDSRPGEVVVEARITSPSEALKLPVVNETLLPNLMGNVGIQNSDDNLGALETTGPLFSQGYTSADGLYRVITDQRPAEERLKQAYVNVLYTDIRKVDISTSMPVARLVYLQDAPTSRVYNMTMTRTTWKDVDGVQFPIKITSTAASNVGLPDMDGEPVIDDPAWQVHFSLEPGSLKLTKYPAGEGPPQVITAVKLR